MPSLIAHSLVTRNLGISALMVQTTCKLVHNQNFNWLCYYLDSKKLTEEKRDQLAKLIEANKDWIGWAVYVISPRDISTNMLRR